MNITRLTSFLIITLFCIQAYANPKPPNFVVIIADDLGYNDLSCYGSKRIKTPHLDQMSSEGLRLTSFYAAAPTCTPSRAGFLTGCYPARSGFGDELRRVGDRISPGKVIHANSPYGLNADVVTLPEVLNKADYETACIGKWHLGDAPQFNPLNHGFDHYFGIPYSNDMKPLYFIKGQIRLTEEVRQADLTTRFTDEATSFISSASGKPFFLYVAYTAPHTPLEPIEEYAGVSERGAYGDVVEELDAAVGKILRTLADNSLASNTLVVFTSDNGPWLARGTDGGSATPFRAGKGTTYEGGMRVPCLIKYPEVVPAGQVTDEIASLMDLFPTFVKLAGISSTGTFDGKDIVSLLRNPASTSPHDNLFFYFGNELHAVRSGQWKYRAPNILPNENIYWKGAPASVEVPEALYNLADDPGEQKDISQNHPKILRRLKQFMENMREDLGDSLTARPPTHSLSIGKVNTE